MGTGKKQLKILLNNVKHWCHSLSKQGGLTPKEHLLSYFAIAHPALIYPMIGHSFSTTDLQPLQMKPDQENLHVCSLNKHFPHAVLYGPLCYGGLGVIPLHTKHIADKALYFLHHLYAYKTTLDCRCLLPWGSCSWNVELIPPSQT